MSSTSLLNLGSYLKVKKRIETEKMRRRRRRKKV
jgi:hypothetical protein